MNEQGNDTPRDDALSALYRQLPAEEPRAETDDAIRAAARRAVGAGPGVQAPWWKPARWEVPVAVAATLVLTLVVVREGIDRSAYRAPMPEMASTDVLASAESAAPVEAVTEASVAAAPAVQPEAGAPLQAKREAVAARDAAATPVLADAKPAAAQPAPAVSALAGAGAGGSSGAGIVSAGETGKLRAARDEDFAAPASAPEVAEAEADSMSNLAADAPVPAPAAEAAVAQRAAKAQAQAVASATDMQRKREAKETVIRETVSAETPWPFLITPATDAETACKQLADAGIRLASASGCRTQPATGGTLFVFTLQDVAGFRQALTERLRLTGWQRAETPGAGDTWQRDGALIYLLIDDRGETQLQLGVR